MDSDPDVMGMSCLCKFKTQSKETALRWLWWPTPVIPVLERLKLEANPDYIARPCFGKPKNNTKEKKQLLDHQMRYL